MSAIEAKLAIVGTQLVTLEQQRDDLITIIDFCDAMAQRMWSWLEEDDDGESPVGHVITWARNIRQAHDIGHVLIGEHATFAGWYDLQNFTGIIGDDSRYGPAWPDVRRRMADVIQRAEAMAE